MNAKQPHSINSNIRSNKAIIPKQLQELSSKKFSKYIAQKLMEDKRKSKTVHAGVDFDYKKQRVRPSIPFRIG